MSAHVWPVDAVEGAPEFSGRILRQSQMAPLLAGATAARPLGTRSGVRSGTPASTVVASSSEWTVRPHAGILDVLPASEAGPYGYAVPAATSGPLTAANATNARRDIVYVQLADPAEGTGGTTPGVTVGYTAGAPSGSPTAPAAPARSMVLAEINVPAVGGGSPTVSWVAPVLESGIWPVRNEAERNALGSALGASALNPLYVHRADLGYGRQLEVSTTGTTWSTVAGDDSGWQPLTTFGVVGGSTNTTWRTRRIGDAVHVKGILRPNSGTIPQGQSSSVGVVASGHRPTETVFLDAAGYIAGSTVEYAPRAIVSIAPSGNMTVWAEAPLSWIQMTAAPYLVN